MQPKGGPDALQLDRYVTHLPLQRRDALATAPAVAGDEVRQKVTVYVVVADVARDSWWTTPGFRRRRAHQWGARRAPHIRTCSVRIGRTRTDQQRIRNVQGPAPVSALKGPDVLEPRAQSAS